jgi:hypothetical protein
MAEAHVARSLAGPQAFFSPEAEDASIEIVYGEMPSGYHHRAVKNWKSHHVLFDGGAGRWRRPHLVPAMGCSAARSAGFI